MPMKQEPGSPTTQASVVENGHYKLNVYCTSESKTGWKPEWSRGRSNADRWPTAPYVAENTPFVQGNGAQHLDEPDEKTNRTHSLVYWIFVLHGIGTLMPWNMFLTIAPDYYINHKFTPSNSSEPLPVYNTNFFSFLGIFSQLPNLILNLLNLFAVLKADLRQRIIYSLAVVSCVCFITIVFVFVDTASWMFGFFVFTMTTVVILNSANGVYQNSIYGLLADFPSHFTNAVVIGNNSCGILITLLLIMTLSVSRNVTVVASVYFSLALATILACLITFFWLPRLPYYAFFTRKARMVREEDQTQSNGLQLHEFTSVLKKAWSQMLSVFLTFFVTLALFPAVLTRVELYPNDRSYNVPIPQYLYTTVVVFLNFNVFATLGNILANHVQWPGEKNMIWLVVARLLFLPFFWFCNYGGKSRHAGFPVLVGNEWIFVIVITIMSLSHGYASSLGMMYAPRSVPGSEARIAGMMSAFFLVLGIAVGVAFTFAESFIFISN